MSTLNTIPLTIITGAPATLADYSGKVLLIVNVASKCGLTPQYTALEALYQKYKDRGLVVLGFPANDFAGQEPGTDAEIATFCSTEYPVTFPLFSKIPVTGPSKHPLYAALIAAAPEQIPHGPWRERLTAFAASKGFPPPNELPELLWNFEKFLIGRNGEIVNRFKSGVKPESDELMKAVETELAKK